MRKFHVYYACFLLHEQTFLYLNLSTQYQYDLNGNLTTQRYNVAGQVIAEAQALSVTDGAAETNYSYTQERQFEYDKAGRQTATYTLFQGQSNDKQKTGQVAVYNSFGEVVRDYDVWGAAGYSTAALFADQASHYAINNTYQYDAAGRLNVKRSSDGYTRLSYDYAGRNTQIEQLGDSLSNTQTARVTTNVYDKLGRVTRQILPGFEASLEFGSEATSLQTPEIVNTLDRWGNVVVRSGSAQKPMTYDYNQDNQVTQETEFTTGIGYNGQAEYYKLTHSLSYDTLGRTEFDTTTSAFVGGSVIGNHTTKHYYNAVGQVTATTQAYGASIATTTSYAYDGHGNRVGTQDHLGHVLVDEFDANNQLVKHSLIRNHELDAFGSREFTGTVNGTLDRITLAQYKYDQAGRQYGDGDAAGNYRYYQFDERNHIVKDRSRAGNLKLMDYWEKTGRRKRDGGVKFQSVLYKLKKRTPNPSGFIF
jgi:YD repeat-containing protein